ncbi:MAG TPA: NADH-quinone oxidoreductase subunit N [Candidatus Eisenbacteria bacterium]|nr:NADH-quinone oxidoreductase subunit N [Candidatus Eisenbacteria bacterium]
MTAFLPETLLLTCGILFLCLALGRESASRAAWGLGLATAGSLLAACVWSLGAPPETLFFSTYRIDLFSQGFKTALAGALLVVVIFSREEASGTTGKRIEYFLFLITATLGMMMMTSAADLLTLYISLELSSYSLYLLASLKADRRGAEAGAKYLLFGAATSGLMLWGFSLLAGLSGTTSLALIAQQAPVLAAQPSFALAVVLVSFAFLFKLSGFPMHFWAPDVYECAPTPVTAFIATASKAAAVAILIRLFSWTGLTPALVWVVGILAFVSMTLGNCAALVQRDVKRLLAYSSIAQAGYLLVGLLAGSADGYASAFFYAIAYLLMNAAAFLVTMEVGRAARLDNPQVSHFDGLAERSPFLALILLLSLLSLAGIPPLAGFTGKWILFSAAMDKGHWFLVLWGVLNSVVSLFYYLTLVKHAYLEKPVDPSPIALPARLKLLGLLLFFALVGMGVFPDFLIRFTQQAAGGLR